MSKAEKRKVTKPKTEFSFENCYNGIHQEYDLLSAVVFDETRGFWGTEVELALSTAEADLASAMEQIEFVRKQLGQK